MAKLFLLSSYCLRCMNHYSLALLFLALISIGQNACGQSILEEAKRKGREQSRYLQVESQPQAKTKLTSDTKTYHDKIAPILKSACLSCHGPNEQEAEFRIDTLNPDLVKGQDEAWWLEVQNVLANKVMPPADSDIKLSDADRAATMNWLAHEISVASSIRKNEKKHTSFRRLNRNEYDYAIQDLLGLNYSIAGDLPPESKSEDGFINSSDRLQMSPTLFQLYREIAHKALEKATVGSEKPESVFYSMTMDAGRDLMIKGYYKALEQINRDEAAGKFDTDKAAKKREALKRKHFSFNPNSPHFINEETGEGVQGRYSYGGGRYSWAPATEKPAPPESTPFAMILPAGTRQIIDLGDHLPDSGTMRIRLRASRISQEDADSPDLQISFGYQPSNNSQTDFPVGKILEIESGKADTRWYEIQFQLGEISRNAFRGKNKLGVTPNPSEYLIFRNLNGNRKTGGIRIQYIEIIAPYFAQWPPKSHVDIFQARKQNEPDEKYARRILLPFMKRAWRQDISEDELDAKLKLFAKLRPLCNDFREVMIEVMATVMASPRFVYVSNATRESLNDFALASRLALFLWSSIPDDELLAAASAGKLSEPEFLNAQIDRMLTDPRSHRFTRHFVRQWLGLELLDFLDVDRSRFARINDQTTEAMSQEPIEMFRHVLDNNHSILDFLHADYTLVNQALAQHYDLPKVYGNEFQKVKLESSLNRGGLLTQAGLLAMNSDGKDTNPLKRGIWLLEKILHDPPPPPPPSVPEIDLTDPNILKLTLKERLEDHRNDVACKSCHARIDPWGIAFENFDAVGQWREKVGSKPVDATSELFNQQKLDGMQGLKRYLLESRQDQFAEAMVYKLSTYALGRPLGFSDRAELQKITTKLRRQDDGLKTLVKLIVTSDLFRSN